MKDDFVLEILSLAPFPMSVKDVLSLLQSARYSMSFSNSDSLKVSIYQSLERLVKKNYIYRFSDMNSKYFLYRYSLSELGLDHLSRNVDLDLVREIAGKIS